MARDVIVMELEYRFHTDKAVLVAYGEVEAWLPLSQIEVDVDLDGLDRGDEIEVGVPEWLADRAF